MDPKPPNDTKQRLRFSLPELDERLKAQATCSASTGSEGSASRGARQFVVVADGAQWAQTRILCPFVVLGSTPEESRRKDDEEESPDDRGASHSQAVPPAWKTETMPA